MYLQEEAIRWPLHYSPNLFLFRPLFRQAKADGLQYMFSGLGGDDVFTPGPAYLSQAWASGDPLTWIKEIFSDYSEIGIKESLKYGLGFLLTTKKWRRSYSKKNLNGLDGKTLKYWQKLRDQLDAYDFNPLQEQLAWRWMGSGVVPTAMEFEQELAQTYGMLMSYPLLDPRLMAWALWADWKFLVYSGQDKRVLRQAASRLLPQQLTNHRSQQDYTLIKDQVIENQKAFLLSFVPDGLMKKYGEKFIESSTDAILQFSFIGRLMYTNEVPNEQEYTQRTRENQKNKLRKASPREFRDN
ncbi:MAG: asparagine synthase-related protein [Bdellovibrionales bacterium]